MIIPILLLPYIRSVGQDSLILKVYFGFGRHDLIPTEAVKIDEIIFNGIKVDSLFGYADTIGSVTANLQLSQKRVDAVAAYLLNRQIPVDSLLSFGKGETKQLDTRSLALNRCVIIHFSYLRNIDTAGSKLTVITLSNLLFLPDKAILQAGSRAEIKRIAGMLLRKKNASFEIRGHVNFPLKYSVNGDPGKAMQDLSVRRAQLVYELLKDEGVPEHKLSFKGMGNSEMLYPNAKSNAERLKNMRVEVLIRQKD